MQRLIILYYPLMRLAVAVAFICGICLIAFAILTYFEILVVDDFLPPWLLAFLGVGAMIGPKWKLDKYKVRYDRAQKIVEDVKNDTSTVKRKMR